MNLLFTSQNWKCHTLNKDKSLTLPLSKKSLQVIKIKRNTQCRQSCIKSRHFFHRYTGRTHANSASALMERCSAGGKTALQHWKGPAENGPPSVPAVSTMTTTIEGSLHILTYSPLTYSSGSLTWWRRTTSIFQHLLPIHQISRFLKRFHFRFLNLRTEFTSSFSFGIRSTAYFVRNAIYFLLKFKFMTCNISRGKLVLFTFLYFEPFIPYFFIYFLYIDTVTLMYYIKLSAFSESNFVFSPQRI